MNGFSRVVVGGGGKVVDNCVLSFDMREVIGFEYGFDDGNGVKGMVGFDGGDGEEIEGVGVKVVKLLFMVEVCDDGLGM